MTPSTMPESEGGADGRSRAETTSDIIGPTAPCRVCGHRLRLSEEEREAAEADPICWPCDQRARRGGGGGPA